MCPLSWASRERDKPARPTCDLTVHASPLRDIAPSRPSAGSSAYAALLGPITCTSRLNSIVAVEMIRKAHCQAEVTSDYRFYLSSLVRSAEDFASLIRQHWHIENKLHWCLDVTFNEDCCRIRKDNAPANMAVLRRLALNLLRQNGSKSISLRQKRLLCSLDEDYLLRAMSGAA